MCGKAPCEKPDCTWGELFRRQCEARWVIRQPKAGRTEYYALVKKHRGEGALKTLIEEVNAQWRQQTQRPPTCT